MAKAKAAWGIEVGNAAVKAVRLERDGSDVRVADYVIIPHPKVLTTPDLNVEEMVRISLGAFAQQKSLEGAAVVGHLAEAPLREGIVGGLPEPVRSRSRNARARGSRASMARARSAAASADTFSPSRARVSARSSR